MSKNVIIGQSGGPTAVINSSLAGVYKAACSLGADKVYGMKYGIEGLLKEEMLELNVLLDDRMSIELLKRTPSILSPFRLMFLRCLLIFFWWWTQLGFHIFTDNQKCFVIVPSFQYPFTHFFCFCCLVIVFQKD